MTLTRSEITRRARRSAAEAVAAHSIGRPMFTVMPSRDLESPVYFDEPGWSKRGRLEAEMFVILAGDAAVSPAPPDPGLSPEARKTVDDRRRWLAAHDRPSARTIALAHAEELVGEADALVRYREVYARAEQLVEDRTAAIAAVADILEGGERLDRIDFEWVIARAGR